MISKKDKSTILRCARKYKVGTVILFGSSAQQNKGFNDIDIGVLGLTPDNFFKFYGELFKYLSKPVDLVDLSKDLLFNRLIIEKGTKIYG